MPGPTAEETAAASAASPAAPEPEAQAQAETDELELHYDEDMLQEEPFPEAMAEDQPAADEVHYCRGQQGAALQAAPVGLYTQPSSDPSELAGCAACRKRTQRAATVMR